MAVPGEKPMAVDTGAVRRLRARALFLAREGALSPAEPALLLHLVHCGSREAPAGAAACTRMQGLIADGFGFVGCGAGDETGT